MLINLTELILNEKNHLETSTELEMKEILINGQSFPIRKSSPVALEITVSGAQKAIASSLDIRKAKIFAETKICVEIPCDRCLEPVMKELNVRVERECFLGLNADEKESSDLVLDESDEDLNDQAFIDGHHLDVDRLIFEEIFPIWPERVLCKEACKGLCPKCGKNLNEGSCDCDLFEPDPRMAKIKDLFAGIQLD